MSRLTDALALGISLLLCVSGCRCVDVGRSLIEAAQKKSPIVDEDYRFRLSSPGGRWRLLPESEIRSIVPDALAGATRDSGLFGIVITERKPDAPLEDFARLVVDGLEMENKELELFENVTFAGRDAWRMVVQGDIKGVRFRFVHHVFFNQAFAYQVLGWGLTDKLDAKGAELDPFFNAFELLEGPVQARQTVTVQKDTYGVGWRVSGGAFESAVTRLAVDPPQPWRVAVGEELAAMNAQAEVGLVSANPDVYATVLLEKAPDSDREAFMTYILESTRQNLGGVSLDEPWETEAAGAKLTFRQFRAGSPEFHYRHAVHFVEGQAMQILVWHYAQDKEQADEILAEGLGAIRFLSDDDNARLTQALEALPDPENVVGRGFSLRGGVYRSFQHGYRLKKGPGLWRFKVGAEARANQERAEISFEEPSRGLYGLVVVYPREEAEAEVLHRSSIEAVFDEPVAATRRDAWWMSEGESGDSGIQLRYRIHTAAHGENAVQLWTWGSPSRMHEAASVLDALLDGFEFDHGILAIEATGKRYRDERLGFELTPPAGWKWGDVTPQPMAELATLVEWRSGDQEFGVLGLCVLGQGRDEAYFVDYVTEILKTSIGRGLKGRPQVEPATFAGQPARRLTWPGRFGQKQTRVYVVLRNQTVYGIYSNADQRKTAQAFKSFRLLD